MKTKPIYCLSLIGIFLFSQILFLDHHVNDSSKTDHPELCFVCAIDTPAFWSLSQGFAPLPDFEKDLLSKNNSLIFVKKNLYSQSLPRSPPRQLI